MPSDPAAARRDAEEARARLLAADSAQARRYAMEECCVALEALLAAEPSAPPPLHFVCTDFPGPGNECVFVECEDGTGRSINAGEWVRRPDGLVALVVGRPAPPAAPAPGMDWSGTTGTVMPPAPSALPPEVHEAAERARKHFHVFPPSPDEILTPFGEDVADLLSALSHSATVAGAPTSWPERHAAELRAACGNPENWPQCVAGDWIETMVQTAGWVCGKCGHQPGHPCHGSAKKPPAPPAAPAPDAVREAAARVAALAEHQTDQHGTPFVTLWGQEGVDAMAALRRSFAARDGGGA